ncbi:sugar phosphate nucleotidyltransferase [Tardisphaera miroshnichenkoae]
MKAGVLAGGIGKRLRPLTNVIPKPLVFVGGAAMIDHCISALRAVGISDVVVVVSPYTETAVRQHLAEKGIEAKLARQDAPLGTGDAVSKLYPSNDDVLIISSDVTVEPRSLNALIEYHKKFRPAATILGIRTRDPQRYGALLIEGERLKAVVEKPAVPVSNVINSGIYVLSEEGLEATRDLPVSPRGEKEVTDAFNLMARQGKEVRVITDEGSWWHDVGDFASLIRANEFYLERGKGGSYVGSGEKRITGQGGVIIGPSYASARAEIRGLVGPFVSVDDGSTVEKGASVEHSILMRDSRVLSGCRLSYSVLAPGAVAASDAFGNESAPLVVPAGRTSA